MYAFGESNLELGKVFSIFIPFFTRHADFRSARASARVYRTLPKKVRFREEAKANEKTRLDAQAR